MILILDYKAGNIKSVYNAFDILGANVKVSNSIQDIKNAKKIVIPGVGSYANAMANIHSLNLFNVLQEQKQKGKHILGICLGMQIFSNKGYEGGETEGLSFIDGEVLKFNQNNLLIPHIGWNEVKFTKKHFLFNNLNQNDSTFYFVHSYYFNARNENNVAGITYYGENFTSIILKDNLVATQFHPEKSQENGIKFLENFIDWNE